MSLSQFHDSITAPDDAHFKMDVTDLIIKLIGCLFKKSEYGDATEKLNVHERVFLLRKYWNRKTTTVAFRSTFSIQAETA